MGKTSSVEAGSTEIVAPPTLASKLGGRATHFIRENGISLSALVLALLVWEAYVRLAGVAVYILPAPSVIVRSMVEKSDLLMFHARYTTYEVVLGFLIGAAVAIPLAIAIVYSSVAEKTIFAFLVASQAIPKVALAPLFVAWFGFSQIPKILITFLISFFPVVVSTVVGLKSMPVEMAYLARSLGASGFETFWKFRLPYGLPSIFGGLKVAISLAVVGAVVGEYVAGNNGLGYLQTIQASFLNTDMVFAVLVYLAVIGIILFNIIGIIESVVIRWDPSRQLEKVKEP